jgi:hypothetical protein
MFVDGENCANESREENEKAPITANVEAFFFVKKYSTPFRSVQSERIGWIPERGKPYGIILQLSVSTIYLFVFLICMSILVTYFMTSLYIYIYLYYLYNLYIYVPVLLFSSIFKFFFKFICNFFLCFPYLILIAVCDHDAVTYRPSAAELSNFPEFISKAYKKHLHESGGILMP